MGIIHPHCERIFPGSACSSIASRTCSIKVLPPWPLGPSWSCSPPESEREAASVLSYNWAKFVARLNANHPSLPWTVRGEVV